MPARFRVVQAADGAWGWRLVGGNHIVLGIAVRPHATSRAASDEVVVVRAAAGAARTSLDRRGASWGWTLRGEGGAVAASARAFDRRTEAEISADRFCSYAVSAAGDPVVARFRPRRG